MVFRGKFVVLMWHENRIEVEYSDNKVMKFDVNQFDFKRQTKNATCILYIKLSDFKKNSNFYIDYLIDVQKKRLKRIKDEAKKLEEAIETRMIRYS